MKKLPGFRRGSCNFLLTFILIILSLCETADFKKIQRSGSTKEYPKLQTHHSEYHGEPFENRDSDFENEKCEILTSAHSNRRDRHKRDTCEHHSMTDEIKYTKFKIPRGYNFFEIPLQPKVGNKTEPLNVTLKARVQTIRDIDEVTEEITLDMEITLGWTDWEILAHRKNFTSKQVLQYIESGVHTQEPRKLRTLNNPQYLKAIWKPNIFIYNLIEKTQPKLMSDLITLEYDPDGGFVYYQTRVTLKMSCPMSFTYYPIDTHNCRFIMRAFSYGEHLMSLQWYKPPFLAVRKQANFEVQLDDYHSDKEIVGSKTFDRLSFTLILRRKLSYHVIQTYIPSTFLIITTWLCFVMPPSMVEARIGISMTTLLTLTAMFSSVRETSPVTAYVKALDLWMVSCIFLVFLTLLEFTLFTWCKHLKMVSDEKSSENSKQREKKLAVQVDSEELEENELETSKMNKITDFNVRKLEDWEIFEIYMEITERFAFRVFVGMFVIYNFIYWSWLFFSSEYFSWDEVDPILNAKL